MNKKIWILLILFLLVLSACGGYNIQNTKKEQPSEIATIPSEDEKELSRIGLDPSKYGVLRESSKYCDGICYYVKGEVGVIFNDGVELEQARQIVSKLGYNVKDERLWNIKALMARVPVSDEKEAISKFRSEPIVKSADYNYTHGQK